jgi:hypothetical protein
MILTLFAWWSYVSSAQAQDTPLIKFTRCHGSAHVRQVETQDPLFDGSVPFQVWPWLTDDTCQGPALSVLSQPGSYVEALAALKARYDESIEAEVFLSKLSERVNTCDPSALEDAYLWVCPTQVDGSYFVDDKDECSRGDRHPATYVLNIGDYAEKYAYKRPKSNSACVGLEPAEVTNTIRRYATKTSLFYLYTAQVTLNVAQGLKKAMDTATWDCLGGLCLNSTGNSLDTNPKNVTYHGQTWVRTGKVCSGKIVSVKYYKVFFTSGFDSSEFRSTRRQVVEDHVKSGWTPPLDQPKYPLLLRYDKKGMREIKEHEIQYQGKKIPCTLHHDIPPSNR